MAVRKGNKIIFYIHPKGSKKRERISFIVRR